MTSAQPHTAAAEGALASIARILAKPVDALRQAFQRGLGDAATCVRARLAFDDAQGPPVLVVYVRLPGESATLAFADEVTSIDRQAHMQAAEERGAALRTAIVSGLVRTGKEPTAPACAIRPKGA
jgi:hypothetical protein